MQEFLGMLLLDAKHVSITLINLQLDSTALLTVSSHSVLLIYGKHFYFNGKFKTIKEISFRPKAKQSILI